MVFSIEWNKKYLLSTKFSGICGRIPYYKGNITQNSKSTPNNNNKTPIYTSISQMNDKSLKRNRKLRNQDYVIQDAVSK